MNNRICLICRTQYSYCPDCSADSGKPLWMTVFCCDNCYNIYRILNDYGYGLLSASEAYAQLSKLDMSHVTDKTSLDVYSKLVSIAQKSESVKKRKTKSKNEQPEKQADTVQM